MIDDPWANLINCGTFNLCRCGHFVLKHDGETGHCYGVDVDDHSIRCDCRKLDTRPDLRVVE